MLRRLERLLSEARLSSNTQDQDTITDTVLTMYANRVQSMIEDRIFISNSANNIFMGESEIALEQGVIEYDLPFDIYAKNALKSVAILLNNSDPYRAKTKIPFISESQIGVDWGYALKESKIVLSMPTMQDKPIVVSYVRKIPTLGKRFGAAISAHTANTVTVGATTDDIQNIDDFFCTVDFNGVVKSRGNRITGYNNGTGVINFAAGTGVIADGDYVIPGEYATSHSQLPKECEKIFLEVLERRVAQRQSATDMNTIAPLTAEEIALVDAVFAKGNDDNEVPPINDYSEYE